MRIFVLILVVLVVALITEALFDSAVAAWVAIGALFTLLAIRVLGWVGLWPSDWPDVFDAGGD